MIKGAGDDLCPAVEAARQHRSVTALAGLSANLINKAMTGRGDLSRIPPRRRAAGSIPVTFLLRTLVLLCCLSLSGCVATAVGVVVGTTAAVAGAIVTAPIKVGGAVIDAATDDDEDEKDQD